MGATIRLSRDLKQAPDWGAGEVVIDGLTVARLYDRGGTFTDAFDTYLDPFGRETYSFEEEAQVLADTQTSLREDLELLRKLDDAPTSADDEDGGDFTVVESDTQISISAELADEALDPETPGAALSRLMRAGVAQAVGYHS